MARYRAHGRGTGRSRRRTLVIMLTALVLVVGGFTAAVLGLQTKYDSNIDRFGDPFAALPEEVRPTKPTGDTAGAANYLLLGSDSRISAGDASQWQAGAQRTDAIMLVHIPADRSGAFIMSIPRDSYVEIPGHGRNKINAAYSFGGPPLLIQTVEQLTGVRIDHLAVVDFEGFVDMTDALGGVEITVPETTGDSRATFEAGTQRMDGATALTYVRQRKNLKGGDLDRVKRQQNWIRSVTSEALSKGTLTNPLRLNAFLEATTRSLSVDDGFGISEIRDLGLSMRSVRADDIEFFTVPVAGLGRSPDGQQSIVNLDETAGDALWAAVSRDEVGPWLAQNPADVLDDTVS